MISEKQQFMAMIKRGQKIIGQDAFAAASLGLGELLRARERRVSP